MKSEVYMLNSKSDMIAHSFVIKTPTGELVIIDGGNREDCPHLLEKLRELSNGEKPRIAGWFLTHVHFDHIDCFMEIIEKHFDEIDIQKIYYNFPSIQFVERNEKVWLDTITEFYRLFPRFADKIVIVSEDDVYEVGGLKFEILFSPDPRLLTINNSCLVIRVEIEGKIFMLLADMEEQAGQKLLAKYGSSLKSDYCQMAHHGSWGVSKEVYDAIAPEYCIWCTPSGLWNNDDGQGYNTSYHQTLIVRKWMDDLGVKKHYVMHQGDQMIEL